MPRNTGPKTAVGTKHLLSFLLHEDEAQKTGMAFEVISPTHMKVYNTFHGYPEEEKASEQIMTIGEARKLYRELCNERDIWQGKDYGPVWEPVK